MWQWFKFQHEVKSAKKPFLLLLHLDVTFVLEVEREKHLPVEFFISLRQKPPD